MRYANTEWTGAAYEPGMDASLGGLVIGWSLGLGPVGGLESLHLVPVLPPMIDADTSPMLRSELVMSSDHLIPDKLIPVKGQAIVPFVGNTPLVPYEGRPSNSPPYMPPPSAEDLVLDLSDSEFSQFIDFFSRHEQCFLSVRPSMAGGRALQVLRRPPHGVWGCEKVWTEVQQQMGVPAPELAELYLKYLQSTNQKPRIAGGRPCAHPGDAMRCPVYPTNTSPTGLTTDPATVQPTVITPIATPIETPVPTWVWWAGGIAAAGAIGGLIWYYSGD